MLRTFFEIIGIMVECLAEGYIVFHQMGFEMVWGCITNFKEWGLGFGLLGILVSGVALVIDALIILWIYLLIRRISIILRTKEINRYNVIGTVTDKIMAPRRHSALYIVRVNYQDMSEDFYSESLYNSINVHDSINLVHIHKLDRNNKIIEAILELPE